MAHTVDLYWHPLSPPARVAAVALLAGSDKVTVNFHLVDLLKGEQKVDSFKAISAKGQVPALVDGDLKLIESHAIARYVATKYLSESLYPTDAVQRAKVDEALEVVRSDISGEVATLVFQKAFAPKFGRPVSEEAITKAQEALAKGFTFVESHFFQGSPSALIGDHITLADLIFAVSLHQLVIVKYDLSAYPKTAQYFETLKKNPFVEKAHEAFYGVLANF